jgi:16S rRNA (guanine966-N2)-methyltransferase
LAINILGGFARGQVLSVPKGDVVRPTSVMLKRRIFDFYQTLNNVTFVDLCAGSGAMAFEAWSRGASAVYLNEVHRHVYKNIEENRENLLLRNNHKKTGEIHCSFLPAQKWIKLFREKYEKFTQEEKEEVIIFLDPPYSEKGIYKEIIDYLKEDSWYFGQLWVESEPKKGLSQEEILAIGIESIKLFEQGDSFILISNFPQRL